VLVREEILQP